MSSFCDDDDIEFLTEIELGEITALERQHTEQGQNFDIELPPAGGDVEENQLWKDGDDHIFRGHSPINIDEISIIQEVETPDRPSCSTAARLRPPPIIDDVLPEKIGGQRKNCEEGRKSVEDDADWNKFLKWFQAQPKFDSPWFKGIPIATLNMNQCLTIIAGLGENNFDQLINFAQLIFSFSKKFQGEVAAFDDDVELKRWSDFEDNNVKLLDVAMLRFKDIIIAAPNHISSHDIHKLDELLEEILQTYITKKMDFQRTSVPEVLVQLYPKGFEEILKTCIEQRSVELLLPVCEKSPGNFLKALEGFHSESTKKSEGIMSLEDEDFHVSTQAPPTKQLAQKLLEALKGSLGSDYINILPAQFQPLFSFEAAVLFKNPKFLINNVVIEEIFDFLNTLLSQCYEFNEAEDFTWFVISLSSNTSRLLKHEKFRSSIQFKKWPYLWKFMRKNCANVSR